MRHKVAGYKLGRNTSHRRSLFRNMVTSLILEERIETTAVKAKAVRPLVEKMITLGKKGDLAARRQAAAYLMTDAAVTKLFDTVAPRFGDRQGGYCESFAPHGVRATALTRHSSNCWAANRFSTKSARSVLKSAPSVPKKIVRRWKKRKRKPDRPLNPLTKKKRRKKNSSVLRPELRFSFAIGHGPTGPETVPMKPVLLSRMARRTSLPPGGSSMSMGTNIPFSKTC